MLAPDDRSTLLEMLEPPAGYELDAAVGLTYTLNLDALLTLPTAFALRSCAAAEESDAAELTPLDVLDALRTYADRITICCDAAGIALPSGSRMGVFAFLEKTVVPMRAPRGGVFHPKLWVVRFRQGDGEVAHRVLIASRNLTFDRSWDTVVQLDQGDNGVPLPGVTKLLQACADGPMVVGTLLPIHRERLLSLVQSLNHVRFVPPPGFTDMVAHPLGISTSSSQRPPFPATSSRALIVSPFLKRSFLDGFPSEWAATCLVSRGDELDRELLDLAPDLSAPAAMDSSGVPRSGFFSINAIVVDEAESNDSRLTGLHAKLFVLDQPGGTSTVFTGSANATTAAFNTNVEFLLQMTGPTREVGVGAFLGSDGLRPLLLSHAFSVQEDDATPDPAREHVDAIRRRLGTLALTAEVTAADDGRFRVHYRSAEHLPELGNARLDLRPLTVAAWSTVHSAGALDHQLTVDEAGISGFLAAQITEGAHSAVMLLSTTLIGVPDGRDERIIAALLGDPVRLIRYLMMLLLDKPEDRFDGSANEAIERSQHATHATLATVPLLEVMARALLGSPARLTEVDRLLRALELGSDLVDEDLHNLWQSMRTAAGIGGARS